MDNREFLSQMLQGCEKRDGLFVAVSFSEAHPPYVHHSNVSSMGIISICEKMAEVNSENGRNVYWSAGLRRLDLPIGSRGTEADITKMVAIVVDLDNAESAATWEQKVKVMKLMPTFAIRTSTTPTERYQLVYLLNEPTDDFDAWKIAARKLESYLGADHCSKDMSHVWRIPNTTNWPNKKKRDLGRVAELSEITYKDGPSYELEDFDILPEPKTKAKEDIEITPLDIKGTSQQWNDMIDIVNELPQWMFKECFTDRPGRDRSEFDFQIAKEVARCPTLNDNDYLALYHMSTDEAFTGKWKEKERGKADAGDAYLAKTMAKALAEVADEPVGEEEDDDDDGILSSACWTTEQLAQLKIPPAKYLAEPFIAEGAIHNVHGPTGQGKSHFLQHITYALACGVSVPPFIIKEQKKVLYIDGEMSARTIKKRVENLKACYGDACDNFTYMSPNVVRDGEVLNINYLRELDRARLARHIVEKGYDVVVLDNVRTLAGGMSENDAEAWSEWNEFLIKLRSNLDVTVIWVHHDKKQSNQTHEGEDYSGSTNALTATEVEVQIKRCPKDEIDRLSESFVQNHTDTKTGESSRRLKNLVTMKYGKMRDGDMSIHKDQKLFWVHEVEHDRTIMSVMNDDELDHPGLAMLSIEEQMWVLHNGSATIPGGKSLRSLEKLFPFSKSQIGNMINAVMQQIKDNPEVRKRILKTVDEC